MVTIREKVKKLKCRSEVLGASCRGYIRLTPKYSLKLFGSKSDRDGSFVRQTIAHSLNFGPKVLFKINNGKMFGYITEHAKTENIWLTDKQMRFLRTKMRSQGWATNDIWNCVNVGLINGEPVLIDFDGVSLNVN